jgi:hypothetical protein
MLEECIQMLTLFLECVNRCLFNLGEDNTKHIILDPWEYHLKDMYDALGGQCEEKLLKVASNFVNQELHNSVDYSKLVTDTFELQLLDQSLITSDYHTSET